MGMRTVKLDVVYNDDTDGSHRVSYEGTTFYLPKSQTTMDPEEPDFGEEVEVEIPEWLAQEKGMI